MIYCKSVNVERIAVHPMNDLNKLAIVELTKYGDEAQFLVWLDDGEGEWFWEFDMSCSSDYERVKMVVLNFIDGCDTMLELAYVFEDTFTDSFGSILIDHRYEEYCNDNCGGCQCQCGEG